MVQYHTFTHSTPFQLENGAWLPEFELAYTTYGKLNENQDNLIWVCHAFTGNANPSLAAEIAENLGIELGAATVGRFSDGEVTVELHQNVRARDVFVVQPTCAPTNENLMELLIMVDALKRASAGRISAVMMMRNSPGLREETSARLQSHACCAQIEARRA